MQVHQYEVFLARATSYQPHLTENPATRDLSLKKMKIHQNQLIEMNHYQWMRTPRDQAQAPAQAERARDQALARAQAKAMMTKKKIVEVLLLAVAVAVVVVVVCCLLAEVWYMRGKIERTDGQCHQHQARAAFVHIKG